MASHCSALLTVRIPSFPVRGARSFTTPAAPAGGDSKTHPFSWLMTNATVIVTLVGATFYTAMNMEAAKAAIDKEAALRESGDRRVADTTRLQALLAASESAMKLMLTAEYQKYSADVAARKAEQAVDKKE
ncbi:hypothetical protein HDU93_002833 [Gonapodya sp. JEL0774]|nr:hypothetical protein HDU93_002833 [Gonapodya sp. JEL0774]